MKHPLSSRRPGSSSFLCGLPARLLVPILCFSLVGSGNRGVAAEPSTAPAAPSAPGAPSVVSLMGRIVSIDATKSRFAVSNATAIYQLHCLPTTLVRRDGPVVKITDLQVGADVMVRGKPEKDGTFSAIYVSPPPNIAFPKMKPSSPARGPKETKPGEPKQ